MKNTYDDSKKHSRANGRWYCRKRKTNATAKEKETRSHLVGRAAEYFMFMDDEEQEPKDNSKICVAKWDDANSYDFIVQLRPLAFEKLCSLYPVYDLKNDETALSICDGASTVLISKKRAKIYPLKQFYYAYGSLFNGYPPYGDFVEKKFEEFDFSNLSYEQEYYCNND